jgi:YVTN family beta-propeller protein
MEHLPDGVTVCRKLKPTRPKRKFSSHTIFLSVILSVFLVMLFGFTLRPASLYASPVIYIPNQFSNSVSVINGETYATIQTIPVGQEPYGIGTSPDGKTVFVTNMAVDTVSVIDAATNTVKQTISVGDLPFGAAVSPDGGRLYVANADDGNVSVIDTNDYSVISTVKVGDHPHGLVLHPDGSKLYVSNYFSSTVSVINTANNSVIKTISVGTYPHGIAIHPSGSHVYTANVLSDNVSVINTGSNAVQTTINTGHYPFVPAVDNSGKNLYVTNYGSNSITVIDVASNSTTATFSVGSAPHGITFDETGARAYVVNQGSNSVSVIDTASRTVITTVPIGKTPIAFGKFVAEPKIPIPTGANVFPSYSGVDIPVRDINPSQAKPLGLGTVAEVGATLSLQTGANEFSNLVDVYLGISMPAIDPSQLYIFTPSGLIPISSGLAAWKSSVTDISGTVLPDVDAFILPTGTYWFYLLVVPAGTPVAKLFEKYYQWNTYLSVVRATDVASKAIALFGTDLDAAVAIFLASDKGYSLDQIIAAIDAGSLSFLGEIQGAGDTLSSPMAGKWGGEVADAYCAHLDPTNPIDRDGCATLIAQALEEMREMGIDITADRMAMLRDVGYTSTQLDGFKKYGCCEWTENRIEIKCCPKDIYEMCETDGCWLVEPADPPTKRLTETLSAACSTLGGNHDSLIMPKNPFMPSQTVSQIPDLVYKASSITCTPTCTDGDIDGYYLQSGCGTGAVDCNDGDNGINPGRQEVCTDGIDNNCDGLIDAQDAGCSPAGSCPDPGYPTTCGPYCYPGGAVCCDESGNACEAGSICAANGCCTGGDLPCGSECMPADATCCGDSACAAGSECCGTGCMPAGNVCCAPMGHCPPGCSCDYQNNKCNCPNSSNYGLSDQPMEMQGQIGSQSQHFEVTNAEDYMIPEDP